MVADGEGPAGERVEDLAERAGADSEQAGPAEDPVGLDGPRDVAMAVLADDPDPGADRPGLVEQGAQASSSSRTSRGRSEPEGPNRWGS